MPEKRPSLKNEKQYESLNDEGMSPGASARGGKRSGPGGDSAHGKAASKPASKS